MTYSDGFGEMASPLTFHLSLLREFALPTSEHFPKGLRIGRSVCLVVIIEVNPCPLRATRLDFFGPLLKLLVRVVVPIPALSAV